MIGFSERSPDCADLVMCGNYENLEILFILALMSISHADAKKLDVALNGNRNEYVFVH
jgi:hypothetical protein